MKEKNENKNVAETPETPQISADEPDVASMPAIETETERLETSASETAASGLETKESGTPEASEPEATPNETATSESATEGSKNPSTPVKRFFAEWGGLIALCACIALIVVMAVLGFVLGGDIYDKVAMLWIVAFIAEFVYTTLYSRKPKAFVVMILTAAMAVVFAVLYGLEVGGLLP